MSHMKEQTTSNPKMCDETCVKEISWKKKTKQERYMLITLYGEKVEDLVLK